MSIKVIHFLSLSGVGGVQKQFSDFYNLVKNKSKFMHVVYSTRNIDTEYYKIKDYKKDSIFNKLWLAYKFFSKQDIIHYYNNLGSNGLNKLLSTIPSQNIILHERGTIWNANDNEIKIYQFNVSKSTLVLANSNATKIMLNKRFDIPLNKIRVLYNGIPIVDIKKDIKKDNKRTIGYIGRLDSHKGVHILIQAAKKLQEKNIILKIAGTGNIEEYLKDLAKDYENIKFVGRVKNPYDFISSLDILVVPSIREPLGNVILEAGLCKVPVIASAVDGIPEIIEDEVSGILLKAKNEISLKLDENSKKTFPELVVDPFSGTLVKAKEIDSLELSNKIIEILSDKKKSKLLSDNLYKKVRDDFSIEKFTNNLEGIYSELLH